MTTQQLIDILYNLPITGNQPVKILVDGVEYEVDKVTFNHTETTIYVKE